MLRYWYSVCFNDHFGRFGASANLLMDLASARRDQVTSGGGMRGAGGGLWLDPQSGPLAPKGAALLAPPRDNTVDTNGRQEAGAYTRPHVLLSLNSVSGLVSMLWYRIPFDQAELSISRIPPTDSPTVRPGHDPG